MRPKRLPAVLLVLALFTGAADARNWEQSTRLTGAGGWPCATWLAAGRNTSTERAAIQWVLGYPSGKIGENARERRFFGPDQILMDARRFCRSHPDESIDAAAREIHAKAVAYSRQRAGADVNSVYSRLRELAAANELPAKVVETLIAIYSYDDALGRTVGPGDTIAVLLDGPGESAEPLFAELILGGKAKKLYRFQPPEGGASYYDETGKSAQTALTRVPVQAGSGVAGFGRRTDPQNRYLTWHQGADWQATAGTPVIATGSGVVQYVGWATGFGKYVRVSHPDDYQTSYAHLAGFAAGVEPRAQVRQGQVIGYVGSTGVSTGPRLHYEVRLRDVPIDPLAAEFPHQRVLDGALLDAFRGERARIDAKIGKEAAVHHLWRETVPKLRVCATGCRG